MKPESKETADAIIRVETVSQLHKIAGFGKPNHPLITIIDYSKIEQTDTPSSGRFTLSLYSINFKNHCSFKYGRELFDHEEGTLLCMAPEQILSYNSEEEKKTTAGWGLYFHPDLIRNTALEKKINEYTFFTYNENEALHLSEQEKETLTSILKKIEVEYNSNIDQFSKELIVSNIELLLNYCKRFYSRQFITRTNQNKDIIIKFENYISEYFSSDKLKQKGIPSVKYCAEHMNLTPNYFSDLLKSETGKNTQEHIHYHLLEKAKSMLISSTASVNEIADELGFEYPQYFSKLFKNKVGVTPSIYRSNEK